MTGPEFPSSGPAPGWPRAPHVGGPVIVAVQHDGQLRVFSWELRSDWGAIANQVGPGKPYARIQAATLEEAPT